jgi:hypothetical protein
MLGRFTSLFSQGFSPYYSNSTYQKYISYLINSGLIRVEHPLSQPYTCEQILDSLSTDDNSLSFLDSESNANQSDELSAFNKHSWSWLLRKDLSERFVHVAKEDSIKGNLIVGIEAGDRYNYVNKKSPNYFFGGVYASYAFRNFGLYSNVRVDEEFRKDTVYFGSTGKLENKVISRSDETYAQWTGKNLTLFAGRINRNFGYPGETSLILSNVSYSFDHFAFTFNNKAFKYTYIFGRLNDIYGFDIRDSVRTYNWNKRFLSIHRFEVSLSKKIEIAFTDVILFGGKDAFPQLQYLNPVNFLFLSKMSDRKGYEESAANALMCIDFYFKPSNRLTLFGQLLIDDMDFTKKLRAIYPDRIGYSGKVIYTDLFPASQVYLSYYRISNWTYTSFYTWGNYTYYGKGLGYPLDGVENVRLGLDTFKHYPFILGFEFTAEEYRLQDINGPFIAVKTDFPIGTPQKSVSLKFNTTFIPNSLISANLSTEFIIYQNYGFVKSQKQSFFNIFLTFKMQGIFKIF